MMKNLRYSISLQLTLNDYKVVTADNGKQGIIHTKLHQPDLILCEANLPHFDGYRVLAELKKDKTTRNIPFMFISASTDPAKFRGE